VVVWEALYKPFGEATVHPHSAVENNFRFAGQYYDAETGLHYNYHRYYDPKTGRYLTPDPIGLAGMDPNLYVYAGLNPINTIDPDGLKVVGSIIRWTEKGLNHIIRRHVTRKKELDASKYIKPSQIKKLAERTVRNPDKVTPQGYGRTLYEKQFGRDIGTKGERINRVVLERTKESVTAFPSHSFKSIVAGVLGFLASLFNPFEAISGELANSDDTNDNGILDWEENLYGDTWSNLGGECP